MSDDRYRRPASYVPSWLVWGSLGVAAGLLAMSGVIGLTNRTPLETSVGVAFAFLSASVFLVPSTVGVLRWTRTYGFSAIATTVQDGNLGLSRAFGYPVLLVSFFLGAAAAVGWVPVSAAVLVGLFSGLPLALAGITRFQEWREQLEPEDEPLDRL